ncbi:ribose-phosphate pyrophosphokinase [Fulvivirga kasyanovii]|uniref:ribose-phosphate diphosphokinase n=1 Tax=Fulvivirga kasyanovii TaxID=396812 RepID=A0ABW9RN21_9BACT|nr:ribose-phosphate pyrophosphokinase [Fulvivirga kasyanovii]MTI25522.1 ribose-phosphate pyrophosphokinase [Fulvivirga kasyanovii]
MDAIIFALPGNEELAVKLAARLNAEKGEAIIRHFPDGETYVRVLSEVKDKKVVLVCTLHQPDAKLLPLYFLSKTVKNLGASHVALLAPYLAYMRQDKRFNEGEGVTSAYFGDLISGFTDALVTIDPHLHRRNSLSEVYPIPTRVMHAACHISAWIRNNITKPVLVGPDSESEQWVSQVAREAGAPFLVLEKVRHGDRDVQVSVPQVEAYTDYTPVLVDDIISTATTMIRTIGHLRQAEMRPPVCIGIHAVFAGEAYKDMIRAGAKEVVTTNAITHESNCIDISDLLAEGYRQFWA